MRSVTRRQFVRAGALLVPAVALAALYRPQDAHAAITDNFDRASLGSGWIVSEGSAWGIISSQFAAPTGTNSAAEALIRTEAAFPNDQYSQADIEYTAGSLGGLCARSNGADTYYFMYLTGTTCVLKKRIAGTNTTIDERRQRQDERPERGMVGGSTVITATDASIASGKPGMFALTGSGASLPNFDNFACTDATPSGTVKHRALIL